MIAHILGLKRQNKNSYFKMIFYRKIKPIQAITFDLDDTLYDNGSIIRQAEQSLVDFMRQHYPETQKVHAQFWREHQLAQLQTSPVLKNDISQLRRLTLLSGFQRLGFQGQQLVDAVEQCYQHFYYQRSNFELDETIYSLLNKLAQQVPLVAITNGNVNLQQIGLQGLFSCCFKASVDMPMKPHASMFNAAQAHLNLPADAILHVGDNLHKDVFGALQAGLQTAWYAKDRTMYLNNENTCLLPHVQLHQLEQLVSLL